MASSPAADAILSSLAAVEAERARRAAVPGLAARVDALKAYQQDRFRLSHADLLASARYGAAAQFFFDELYGPGDFSHRDAQFARIVPALVRLFPAEIVATVATLGALHALSEALDGELAGRLPPGAIDARGYAAAWQASGRRPERERQIALLVEVGRALDRYTRKPMLGTSLRLMRGPARAAGLSELQAFLERGLQAFKSMRGADDFLHTVEGRERDLLDALDDAAPAALAASGRLP